MAKSKKKNKNAQKKVNNQAVNAEAVEAKQQEAEVVEEKAEVEAPKKAEKVNKAEKKQKDKKKAKKNTEPRQNKAKETVAELKKVTWPTAGKVAKNTLLVIFIVLISTVVLFGIDYGLSWIYKLLTGAI